MGAWSIPLTEATVSELEGLMAAPLRAADACGALNEIAGDDTLFELVERTAGRRPDADVRSLVAMTLDEWAFWSDASAFARPALGSRPAVTWPEPLRERCRALVTAFREADVEGPAMRAASVRDADAALLLVARCVPGATSADLRPEAGRFEVAAGPGPGTHAVRDGRTGAIFRVEVIHGVVIEAPEGMRGPIAEAVFETSPAPAP